MLDHTAQPDPPDLAAYLLATGQIDATGLARADTIVAESDQSRAAAMVQLGLIGERSLALAYATMLSLRLLDPADYPAAPVLPERLRPRFLRDARALPIALEAGVLHLAMVDPERDFVRDAIAAATGLAIRIAIAVPIDLDAALARLYPDTELAAATAEPEEPNEADAERLKDLASEAPVIRLVNQLIARAVETQASDIHIEPEEDRLRIRYRYDGALVEAETQPAAMAPAIMSRIKIMARLDIAERRLPQDGRIKLAVRGHEVDFRVSSIPSLHGETISIRVLDRGAVRFDFAALGLDPGITAQFRTALAARNGIVLVTGPTGSGKTTTLYTALASLDGVARNITTIEDPIEYQLRGVNQSQVKPQIGLDFAQLLRALLRQDPDVIMVGEIRDLETAQIAARAALTGHLVLSTLHTNSAAATVTRLRDMGLEPYLIASVLRGVLAQRLIRRLCDACKRPARIDAGFARRFSIDDGATIFHPVGCAACRGTGYRGRRAIAEFLVPDATIGTLLADGASEAAIAGAAGMRSLALAAVDAVVAGETSMAESASF
ncbi:MULTISPECIES: GspE/PulE family protein [Acidiphilium]|uniref:General secretion pathway protein E n=1 Tax=Acidiphilium rubrum TaxID=526 RepID=A0A8G2CHT1_ACIRU|nr:MULTISPECIES: GspE/PulE family protein [Acidiphilium]SIQ10397.1 general secretion pathway protein E [Acidiphilium rubrum]